MNTSYELFEDLEVPIEDPLGIPNKNILRMSPKKELKNVLVSNKGNIKSEDSDKFVIDTIEVLDDNSNLIRFEKCEELKIKYQIHGSRRAPFSNARPLEVNHKVKMKSKKLSEVRKLIGQKSARMSSNKVLGILLSTHFINQN